MIKAHPTRHNTKLGYTTKHCLPYATHTTTPDTTLYPTLRIVPYTTPYLTRPILTLLCTVLQYTTLIILIGLHYPSLPHPPHCTSLVRNSPRQAATLIYTYYPRLGYTALAWGTRDCLTAAYLTEPACSLAQRMAMEYNS